MEPPDFRDLLPGSRRAAVNLLIELKKWPMLKEFISAESQEVQHAFEVFMKSVDKSGDHVSIRSPQLPSEETSAELLQLEKFHGTDDAKKEVTKDDRKFTISDIKDLHSAVRQGDEELVRSLIDKGVDVNGKEAEDNFTPLHVAVLTGHVDTAKLLLDKNADVNACDYKRRTPLHIAAKSGHEQMVNLLLDKNADVNACNYKERTPLHMACKKNMIEVVTLLLKYKATIEITNKDGESPFHFACMAGAINCVIYLLERGANPNTITNNGSTALYMATYVNHIDLVKILIGTNEDASHKIVNLQSALSIASFKGHIDIVTLLLEAGANPNGATKDNETFLQVARSNGHNEVAGILILTKIYGSIPVYCSTEEDAASLRAQNLIDVRICDTNGGDYIANTEYAAVNTLIAECPLSNKKRNDLVLKKFHRNFLDSTKPHFIKYSAREVEISLRLRHVNIGSAEGIYVQKKNDAYLITGLVFEHYGTELRQYIGEKREDSIINTSTIVTIATQIASALQFMHGQVPPVIHRDVKPNNILVSERDGYPHVKLIDFGQSRVEAGTAKLMTANLTDHTYTAPELFATGEETNYTTTVDIYSFGMVLYFVTVGKNPFPKYLNNEKYNHDKIHNKDFGNYINSPNEVGNYPRPGFHAASGYPKSLKKLIEDCWKHSPEERLRWDEINDILKKLAAMSE